MSLSRSINQGSRYILNNGRKIPVIGYGVYDVPKDLTAQLVRDALEAGYRHIDTAFCYGNQVEAAKGVQEFLTQTGIPREEVFFTTKLWNDQQGYNETKQALKEAAKEVKAYIGYIDLLLLHSPLTSSEKRLGSWKALEEAVSNPEFAPITIKSIGVSNFGIKHLDELLSYAKIKPVLNQLELHPWLPRIELRDYLKKHEILAEAYSPLTQGFKLNDPELLALAHESKEDKAGLLLKWSFLQGFVVLVKSVKPERIVQNLATLPKSPEGSLSLSEHQLQVLNKPDSHEVLTWDNADPTLYEK